MTLQRKTLIIIGVTLVGLLAGLYLGVRFVLLRGFDEYEMDRARTETALIRRSYLARLDELDVHLQQLSAWDAMAVSYTHLRAHETVLDLVCRLLLEKKNTTHPQVNS